jgi:septal ring factor EnvC (AmiA/AmiB activator)
MKYATDNSIVSYPSSNSVSTDAGTLTTGIRLPILEADNAPYFTRATKMAGASDPGVSTALATQSKQIESQSKHLAAQSKLLQQLCNQLEAQDLQWGSLKQSFANNAEDITSIHHRLDRDREDLSRSLDAHLA